MGFLNLFGGKTATSKKKTLVLIDWEAVQHTHTDFSFLNQYPNAAIFIYYKTVAKTDRWAKIQQKQAVTPVQIPATESNLVLYLSISAVHELLTNPVYKQTVFVTTGSPYSGVVEFLKLKGFDALEFRPDGGRSERGRNDRNDRDRGDRRNDREPRSDRDRTDRNERSDREPRSERGEGRTDRSQVRPERGPRTEREPRMEREPRTEREPRNDRGQVRNERPERSPRPEREDSMVSQADNGHAQEPRVDKAIPAVKAAEPVYEPGSIEARIEALNQKKAAERAQRQQAPRREAPLSDDAAEQNAEPLDNQADLELIVENFAQRYEIGQTYEKNYFSAFFKQVTGKSVQDLYRTSNPKLLVSALLRNGVIEEADEDNYRVLALPTLEQLLALNRRGSRSETERREPRGNGNGHNSDHHAANEEHVKEVDDEKIGVATAADDAYAKAWTDTDADLAPAK